MSDPSERFWDAAARSDAAWYIATGVDADRFFESGREETDTFLAHCGIIPDAGASILEIGCGMGRMTARLSELYRTVIALDVSSEMLERARRALPDVKNVTWLHGNGRDLSGVPDEAVDVVLSYIVLQHVPTADGQLGYIREARRVLKPGGVAALQVRADTPLARGLDWVGHIRHRASGRMTLDKAWRGSRIPRARLISTASGSGAGEPGPPADVDLRPFGRRHLWVVMRRHPD
jgi:SAM-dependent methyltransferase